MLSVDKCPISPWLGTGEKQNNKVCVCECLLDKWKSEHFSENYCLLIRVANDDAKAKSLQAATKAHLVMSAPVLFLISGSPVTCPLTSEVGATFITVMCVWVGWMCFIDQVAANISTQGHCLVWTYNTCSSISKFLPQAHLKQQHFKLFVKEDFRKQYNY